MEIRHETGPCTHAGKNVFSREPHVQNMVRMLRTSLEEGLVSLLHLRICIVLSSVTTLSSVIGKLSSVAQVAPLCSRGSCVV